MTPESYEEVAELLRESGEAGRAVRPVGAGTKLGWAGEQSGAALSTARLDRILEHNAGDLTAVLQAGVPLARAQETFAAAGQMLALDPPGEAATIGGIVAAADSGPLRHRYGGPRDLVIGIAVALSDGSIARAGGKVIKNVAGYDLAKLFTGSFGTLGVILEVAVRLHPLPRARATAVGRGDDPEALARAASALAHAPLELESLDIRWEGGEGAVLARAAGAAAKERAAAIAMPGLAVEVVEDDDALWAEQRARQRSAKGAIVKVSGLQSELASVLRAADGVGGSVVGRAALGLSWVAVPDVAAAEELRGLGPSVVLDGGAVTVDEGPALELMRRVKARFDVYGVMNPGVLV
ncbi:MAG: FAD-binding oxidoreductase [Actinomycetota bacterium]|nr:FAD-binding oxidoreductase [Actinomycetota bacterium]